MKLSSSPLSDGVKRIEKLNVSLEKLREERKTIRRSFKKENKIYKKFLKKTNVDWRRIIRQKPVRPDQDLEKLESRILEVKSAIYKINIQLVAEVNFSN